MLIKECKYRIKSIIFLIAVFAIGLMAYTSIVPDDWFLYAEPMDFSQYSYMKLKQYIEQGKINVLMIDDMLNIPVEFSKDLNQETQQKVEDALRMLNPLYTKDEKLADVQIVLENDSAVQLIRNLERDVGGFVEYGSNIESEHELYLSQRLNTNTNPTLEEKIAQMEESVYSSIGLRCVEIHKWGISSEYPLLVGSIRYKKLSEEEMNYLFACWNRMQEEKKNLTIEETWEYYQSIYDEIDKYFGGKTEYSKENRHFLSERKNTLEEERQEFAINLEEGYSVPYARYFCDYLGIVAGILPILYAAFIFRRDKRNRVQEYMAVSSCKSISIVGKRLLSVQVVFVILFYLSALAATVYFQYIARQFDYSMNQWAFFHYVTIWIVPTVMITSSISVFLDLLLKNSLLTCLTQILIFFISIKDLFGHYAWYKTVIRFNLIGRQDLYQSSRAMILTNRIVMLTGSLLLFVASVYLYEKERNGHSFRVVAKFRSIINALQKRAILMKGKVKKELPLKNSWKYQLQQAFTWSIAVTFIFVCFVGILSSPKSAEHMKRIGENYLALSAGFLFIPLCCMEQGHSMYELVCVQKKNYIGIYMSRLLMACILEAVILAVPLCVFSLLQHQRPEIWYAGIYLSAIFLGLLGMLTGELFKKRRVGIAVIVGYYMLCVALEQKFSYMSICGYTYQIQNSKKYLLLGCIVEIWMLLLVLWSRRYGKERRI